MLFKRTTMISFALIAATLLFLLIIIRAHIYKPAIKYENLTGLKYILCKSALVTGYEWELLEDRDVEIKWGFCKITGAIPDIDLKYDFIHAHNTFIFYVEERKVYYCEELREECVEYVISGWDVLYPIKRFFPANMLLPRKYITTFDLLRAK